MVEYLNTLFLFNKKLLEVAKPRIRERLPPNGDESTYLASVAGMINYVDDTAHRGWIEYKRREPERLALEPRGGLIVRALHLGDYSTEACERRHGAMNDLHREICSSIKPNLEKLDGVPSSENIMPCLIKFDMSLEELAKVDPQLLLYYKAYGLNQTSLMSFYFSIKAKESPKLPEYVKRALASYEGLVVLDTIRDGFLHLVGDAKARGINPEAIEKAVQVRGSAEARRVLENYLEFQHYFKQK